MSTCLLITTRDRTDLLQNSLERLSDLTVPDEVLVVDDGGTDELFEVCEAYREDLGLPLRYVRTNNPGQSMCSHARNVGICSTDADIVITCEPEVMFETDAVAQMLALHAERPDLVVSAGTINHVQEDGSVSTIGGWLAPYVALYERRWLLEVGGWDERFPDPWGWDDVDLMTRLRIALAVHQHVDRDIVATHQYHEPGWRGITQAANEAYFLGKGFHTDEATDLVANVGLEGWGCPR